MGVAQVVVGEGESFIQSEYLYTCADLMSPDVSQSIDLLCILSLHQSSGARGMDSKLR